MRIWGGMPTGLGNNAGVAGAIAAEPDWSKFRPGSYGQLQKGKPTPGSQPVLPGENPTNIQDVYGPAISPGQRFLPQAGVGSFPLIAQVYPGAQPIGNQGAFSNPLAPEEGSAFNSLLDQMTEKTINNSLVPVQSRFPYPFR